MPLTQSLTLLVISADPAATELMKGVVRQSIPLAEFRTVPGHLGLDSAPWDDVQFVLADFNTSDVDFCATFHRIRERRANLPIILVADRVDDEAVVDLLRQELTDLVFKDRLVRLVPAIRRLLVEVGERRALRASENRLANVLKATREAVWDCDLTTGRVAHNRRWCEVLGFDESMLEHPVELFFERIHPEDRPAVQARIDAALTQCNEYSAEYRLRHGDGSYLWVADHGLVTARAPDGRPLRILGAFADISPRKAALTQLEQVKNRLHALAARLQAVREEERSRIAAEVHDELGQMLTALTLDLAALGKRIRMVDAAGLRNEMQARLDDIDVLVLTMIASVREIASELRPQVLDSLGLPSAIRYEAERFQQRSGIACTLSLPEEVPQLPPEQATVLFRILQEALTNVVRHARAGYVHIALARNNGGLTLTVSDDGRGITADEIAAPGSLGLLGMHERAAQFAGSVDIAGTSGAGTSVTVTLP